MHKTIYNHNIPSPSISTIYDCLGTLRSHTRREKLNNVILNDVSKMTILSDERKELKCLQGEKYRVIFTTNQLVEEILQVNVHEHRYNKNKWYLEGEDRDTQKDNSHIIALDLLWYMHEKGLDSLSVERVEKGGADTKSRPYSNRFNEAIEKLKKNFLDDIPKYAKEMDEVMEHLKESLDSDELLDLLNWTSAISWDCNLTDFHIPKHLTTFLDAHAREILKTAERGRPVSLLPAENTLRKLHKEREWGYNQVFLALGVKNSFFADVSRLHEAFVYGGEIPAKLIAKSKYKNSKDLVVSRKNLINSEVLKYRQSAKGEEFYGE